VDNKKDIVYFCVFSLRFYIKIPVSVVMALVSWYGSNVQKSMKYHLCIGRRICDMKRCTVDGIADRRRGLQILSSVHAPLSSDGHSLPEK